MKYFSSSSEETQKIAADFVSQLHGGETIALEGNLGSGKTTFVQGIARALGITNLVCSPTFTVLQSYKTNHETIHELIHIDAYRLRKPEDILNLGLEDWMGRDDVVLFIEWPQIVSGVHLESDYEIQFSEADSSGSRTITIQSI
ncbi:MAG: ATP/GTP hydrolase [Candidatus Uhrbacteria bacterium GW2011_GWF2_41_16]|uniref:tRNA threonylcarbamoyladenosine biosynthesis protein TsaE n=2 Tax=Candidatus Uhriibacteriota TaxID=1752732 RepID=A0A0G0YED4_9BACT|nr:MAG: ATP/GTP hydrolase [Candidatus Uhrbacteria bacterium GW2011_GWA2_41_10]KKR87728.1 MAG: ATP/GTP hydrolase [Candidatus Uhrbacteria bacterium GW2011_GWC2_41_11]KKR98667.1 MAG: ATP/GTP hydrolase [Candidatus Uhrbacteria bacterium GW2011_GWF2_41_16]HBP00394.1 tRNA (adenosine(37)-N6)-threonylcarbamoyltransferase complex ATPase subunit type 1 TsaE [Candidatus Uhrbacteria bacterium]